MKSFLEEVAEKILNAGHKDLTQIRIVFNNRRSGIFLKKEMSKIGGRAMFIPKIMGMNELVEEISGVEVIGHEELLCKLYEIHCELADEAGEDKERFTAFATRGEMMLSDFSEIDLYCVDAKALFCNVHEMKEIEGWDIEGKALTEGQKRHLKFYKQLYIYYSRLRKELIEKGQAYSGMSYRIAAETIGEKEEEVEGEYIYFVGFNALSNSEQKIIQTLIKTGRAALITDGDAYYYNDKQQEAGYFLNKLKEQFADIGEYKDHFGEGEKKIEIVNCPEPLLQTKYAGELLKEIIGQSDDAEKEEGKIDKILEETAIVLADEGLLVPMLNSLPKEIKTVNATMGYPYIQTDTHAWVENLIDLTLHKRNGRYPWGEVYRLISNPSISPLIGNRKEIERLKKEFEDKHLTHVTAQMLMAGEIGRGIDMTAIEPLLAIEEQQDKTLIEKIRTLSWEMDRKYTRGDIDREVEAREVMRQAMAKIEEMQERYVHIEGIKEMKALYEHIVRQQSIPLQGKALTGLQLLGVLETRNLDFRRVIILSVNEGTLPSGKTVNTLIPFILKTAYKIPTYREKDAIYANHFYRLLQRAEDIHILYSSQTEATGKGEESRFVMQIRNELAKRYANITLKEKVLTAENRVREIEPKQGVAKTPTAMKKIKELAQRGLSPSALNMFIDCEKRFYYQYVIGVKEREEIDENIASHDFGTIVHKVLEDIYKQDLGRGLRIETLTEAIEQTDKIVAEAFGEYLSDKEQLTGYNQIQIGIAKEEVRHLLEQEKEMLKQGIDIQVIGLEKRLKRHLSEGVCITGIADRIDRVGGKVRIVDYKTGKVSESDLQAPTEKYPKIKEKWFQVMLYAWTYMQNEEDNGGQEDNSILGQEGFMSGIYPLRLFNTGFLFAHKGKDEESKEIKSEDIQAFEQLLWEKVGRLMQEEGEFEANGDEKSHCPYCPMREVCLSKK